MQTTFKGIPDNAQKPASAQVPAQIGAQIPDWCAGLPALSVRQPWATSIIHFGKPVENRKWWGAYLKTQLALVRKSGGRFLIHAAKGFDQDDIDGWKDLTDERPTCRPTTDQLAAAGIKQFGDLPLGGIIGAASFVDWVERHDSPWFVGPGALVLGDVVPLPFTPCRGMLGFFKPQF